MKTSVFKNPGRNKEFLTKISYLRVIFKSSRSHVFINNFPIKERIQILKLKDQLSLLPDDSTDINCRKLYYYSHRPIELKNLTVEEFYANYNFDLIKK